MAQAFIWKEIKHGSWLDSRCSKQSCDIIAASGAYLVFPFCLLNIGYAETRIGVTIKITDMNGLWPLEFLGTKRRSEPFV